MLEKKMHLAGHWLTRTGRTRYSKNMNIVFLKKFGLQSNNFK